MKKVRTSQSQIARDLGLSQTLVSMVLNGRRHGVSEESYRQIWFHARQVGYKPKGMNPELAGEVQASMVGFILGSGLTSGSPLCGVIQHQLHEALSAHHLSLLYFGGEEHLELRKLKEFYGERKMLRGLVILGEVKRTFLHALRKFEPRIVSVAAQYPGLCHSVTGNEDQAAVLLAQHLAGLGHREFAWLGANRNVLFSRRRFEAIQKALNLQGLSIHSKFFIEAGGTACLDGAKAAELLLKASDRRRKATAWICCSETVARGAVNFLLRQRVRIPGDISVAAFDRTHLDEGDHPTLTTAGVSPEKLGRLAVEMLLRRHKTVGETFSDTVLASDLVAGESTGACTA